MSDTGGGERPANARSDSRHGNFRPANTPVTRLLSYDSDGLFAVHGNPHVRLVTNGDLCAIALTSSVYKAGTAHRGEGYWLLALFTA